MRQLMYNQNFSTIIDEPISYWKTIEEVPTTILEDIEKQIGNQILQDEKTKVFYCPSCTNPLDKHLFCTSCKQSYKSSTSYQPICLVNIEKIKEFKKRYDYLAFQVVDQEVLLYVFQVNVQYSNKLWMPYQSPRRLMDMQIEKVYHVLKNGLEILNDNSFQSYISLEEEYDFTFFETNFYLYLDNLEELKKTTLYQYSFLWLQKDYFQRNGACLREITYLPINFKTYEYLVKMKLYKLASSGADQITYSKNFEKTFGLSKTYYSFMKEYDLDYDEYEALQFYPTTNYALLQYIKRYKLILYRIRPFVKPEQVQKYLKNQNLSEDYTHEYSDYLDACLRLGIDLQDKKILFPPNFLEEHDKRMEEVSLITNKELDKKIKAIAKTLKKYTYEDEKYIIIPAASLDSLIKESQEQRNCVRIYAESIANHACQIFFLRDKKCPKKALVTVEVRKKRVVQARTKFNNLPSEELNKVLKKWEQTVLKQS